MILLVSVILLPALWVNAVGMGNRGRTCLMDIKVYENPNDPECIRCGDCVTACPNKAIKGGLYWQGPEQSELSN